MPHNPLCHLVYFLKRTPDGQHGYSRHESFKFKKGMVRQTLQAHSLMRLQATGSFWIDLCLGIKHGSSLREALHVMNNKGV